MVISNNKKQFTNLTAGNSGALRTSGGYISGQNELFMAFKPATYCKTWGYLRVSVTGRISTTENNKAFWLYVNLSKPGLTNYPVSMIQQMVVTSGYGVFSAQVNIPVGTGGDPESLSAVVTSHLNGTTDLHYSAAYIDAGPDEVVAGTLSYAFDGTLAANSIAVTSIVAEYLEA